ncbi:MAG: hypothetical protein ACREMA_04870 [Longimicrobiales bacterium]
MGFHKARRDLLAALATGHFLHEPRDVLSEKNLLAVGDLAPADVARVISRASGRDYATSQHHWDRSVTVHLFTPVVDRARWYVKVYFLEDDARSAVFISVHATGSE